MRDPVRTQRGTALITGATSGIGLELARQFAQNYHPLVLVARHEDKLNTVAKELQNAGAPRVLVLPVDLCRRNGPMKIYEATALRGVRVDILVNDAGMAETGPFVATDLERELDIIQLNIVSLLHLTKLFLRDMVERNAGRILQVAAIDAYSATPHRAVYAATKAFVLSFADAVAQELKGTNVTMTALLPSATDTALFSQAESGPPEDVATLDPVVVARLGYEGVMRGAVHAYAVPPDAKGSGREQIAARSDRPPPA